MQFPLATVLLVPCNFGADWIAVQNRGVWKKIGWTNEKYPPPNDSYIQFVHNNAFVTEMHGDLY